jgi:hypothetical protein
METARKAPRSQPEQPVIAQLERVLAAIAAR